MNEDNAIPPPETNNIGIDTFADIDGQIDAVVTAAELSDGLDELERLAAECGASDSSESSQEKN